jgi:prevent-host-death family protein
MRTIAVGKFKDTCLKTIDDVAKTKSPVIITKRGQPVAKLIPYMKAGSAKTLVGSVLQETGDPFGTGDDWDADAS